MMRALSLVSIGLLLTGCAATHPDAGSGPITISPAVTRHFEEYKAQPGRDLYVVTIDGKRGTAWSCQLGANCSGGGQAGSALAACQTASKGVPCKVLAVGDSIVWDGPVTFAKPKAAKDTAK